MTPHFFRQRGFGVIAAIMVLVILAALAAAILVVSAGQQRASAFDVLAARALQVASAGTEWGLHRALQGNVCGTDTWASPDDPEFIVTVACLASTYNDGESAPGVAQQVRVFQIVATACNGGAAACPHAPAAYQPGYVERSRQAVAYCTLSAGVCAGP